MQAEQNKMQLSMMQQQAQMQAMQMQQGGAQDQQEEEPDPNGGKKSVKDAFGSADKDLKKSQAYYFESWMKANE